MKLSWIKLIIFSLMGLAWYGLSALGNFVICYVALQDGKQYMASTFELIIGTPLAGMAAMLAVVRALFAAFVLCVTLNFVADGLEERFKEWWG